MIEYRVKPITRFIVTRFTDEGADLMTVGSVTECGEFPNETSAKSAAINMWIGDKLQNGEGLPNIEQMIYDLIDNGPTGPRTVMAGSQNASQSART